jgi:hypothetical protein
MNQRTFGSVARLGNRPDDRFPAPHPAVLESVLNPFESARM